MEKSQLLNYIKELLNSMPEDWLQLTTHRLDIYNESLAKTEFLDQFQKLVSENNLETDSLNQLATAYDYIRLGHPLSSILEWAIANLNGLPADQVISFSSRSMPVLAVLRKNLFDKKKTVIYYSGEKPEFLDENVIREVYGYDFEMAKVNQADDTHPLIPSQERRTELVSERSRRTVEVGSTILIANQEDIGGFDIPEGVDFFVNINKDLGSIILVNGEQNAAYVSAIQHVRRRESIAMTPDDCLTALKKITGKDAGDKQSDRVANLREVRSCVKEITHSKTKALVGSSGLSVQYAIMMGLIDDALENHPGKPIKFLVPPNCYGGTNDQARRVAACLEQVEIVDLPVDREHDMDKSVDRLLDQAAQQDAVPYIIAEIPTNPRVEVPDLDKLKAALSKGRKNPSGEAAVKPVFILDQTFCPNVNFLGAGEILADVQTIAYVSGSKFPSGGKCTAGYCVSSEPAKRLMPKIEKHLKLCDNEATDLQLEILAEQLPSMNQRIADAYTNTREFVNFIEEVLPEAKINFVSEELAQRGFTPSVFSLDLPTRGETEEERENFKRALNHKLINMMISQIPNESKYCVSYGQLKGVYWTIPATSTQGTTKEGDKDYIARVSVSSNLNLEKHKEVFAEFVKEIEG